MVEFKDMTSINGANAKEGVSIPQETSMADLACYFNESQDTNSGEMKSLVAAAKAYGIKKDAIKEADIELKKRKADLRGEELILYDMFQAVGITSIKAEGRTYFTRVDTYASVDASKKDIALEWIDEVGWDYLIAKTVNAKSLTREIKAFIEGGGKTPGEGQGIKLRTENRVSVPRR